MAEKDTTAAKTLAKFQTDAVSTLLQIIDEYGGAVLADSTGLGKTHVGLEVIRQKMLGERKKVLLIAPAQVRDTVWAGKLGDGRNHGREDSAWRSSAGRILTCTGTKSTTLW